ncbi:MAG: response regulator [Bacteroidetes bacterium]|nr:response regulator [Bacteroidota bacterium]
MRPKLNKILLIDDSEADNFIHQRVIKKADVAHNIIVKNNGQSALDYLCTQDEDGNYPVPELVFLDINMPAMNGWEFLEHYDKLKPEQKAGVIVCMLTTSVAEVDRQRAGEVPLVESFLHKPLTQETLLKILDEYFLKK